MMSRDDADIVIHPKRGKKELPLPSRALLVVNPFEAREAAREFLRHGAVERRLYNSRLLVDDRERFCLAGPALGAPAAGLVLEKLIVLGVKEVWLFGCCGVIDPRFEIGDVLVPTSAVCGEGVSRYYGRETAVRPAPAPLHRLREFLSSLEIPFREGAVWSTDAPYREHRGELLLLQERYGVVGVDMELSGLLAIASFRKITLAALFVVSDELFGPIWKPGFTEQRYRHRCRLVIEGLIRSGLDHM